MLLTRCLRENVKEKTGDKRKVHNRGRGLPASHSPYITDVDVSSFLIELLLSQPTFLAIDLVGVWTSRPVWSNDQLKKSLRVPSAAFEECTPSPKIKNRLLDN